MPRRGKFCIGIELNSAVYIEIDPSDIVKEGRGRKEFEYREYFRRVWGISKTVWWTYEIQV